MCDYNTYTNKKLINIWEERISSEWTQHHNGYLLRWFTTEEKKWELKVLKLQGVKQICCLYLTSLF